jgi:uroporphyrinogen-III synthase
MQLLQKESANSFSAAKQSTVLQDRQQVSNNLLPLFVVSSPNTNGTAMLILTTRPTELVEPFNSELQQIGCQTFNEAMLMIVPLKWSPKRVSNASALVITSINGAKELAKIEDRHLHVPIFAVGLSTAEQMINLGYRNVHYANGTAVDLIRVLCSTLSVSIGPILHVGGKHISVDIASALSLRGYNADHLAVYDAIAAASLSRKTCKLITAGEIDAIVFMSRRTAQTFCMLLEQNNLVQYINQIKAFVMSREIGQDLTSLGWREIFVAPSASRSALVELIQYNMETGTSY